VRVDRPDAAPVAEAARVLGAGGIVAFPTETVYGLAVNADDEAARRRLYEAKGRDARKACAFLLASRDDALRHVERLPSFAQRLADAFWPGPCTLVVPGPDGTLVGLRLSSDPLPRALAEAAGCPILQTSANRSGEPAATDAKGVADALGDAIDLLLDGGPTAEGRPSTVVQCDDAVFSILREGAIPADRVLRVATDLTLVACTGNLCRSPMAEGFFRMEAAALLGCDPEDVVWRGHRFGSFGVMAVPGLPPTPEAVKAAAELGADIAAIRSRRFALALVHEARRVFGASRSHVEFLQPYFHERPKDLDLLRPDGKDIDDPIGRGLRVYRRVARELRDACRRRVEEILAVEARP
jgi:L-threonylcarbamoyladenylate synthase